MSERYVPMTYFESLEQARTTLREESLLALEKQIEYMEFMNSSASKEFMRAFVETYGGIHGVPSDHLAPYLHSKVKNLMGTATTYFVSNDMTEMVRMAAEEMPRVGLSPADLLTDSGFLWFHHPIKIVGPAGTDGGGPDDHGLTGGNYGTVDKTEEVGIRAIAWEHVEDIRSQGRTRPGVAYYLFHDTEYLAQAAIRREADEWVEIAKEAGQELPEPIMHLVPPDVQKSVLREMKSRYGPFLLYDYTGWAYGRSWEPVPYDEPARPDDEVQGVHPVVDQARLLLLATWKMLSQKIVQIESQRPPRHMRRRASRAMPETGDVVVIRLRREYHPNGGEDEAALRAQEEGEPWFNHRFLVRGHWRRQPYGREGETKLIWIAPYIKGPEDRPLIVKSKIYSLEA